MKGMDKQKGHEPQLEKGHDNPSVIAMGTLIEDIFYNNHLIPEGATFKVLG